MPAGGTLVDGVQAGDGMIVVTYEPRPDVTTGDASSVSETGATLPATINPLSNASTYHFDYGTTSAYGQVTGETSAGNGTTGLPVTAAVSGLTPGTTYHYRVAGTTCGGCPAGTTPGDDRVFTTGGTAPVADPPIAGAPPPFVPPPPGASTSSGTIAGPTTGKAKPDGKGAFTVPGAKAACPAGGPDCTVTVTIDGAGAGSFPVRGGKTSAVKAKLGKKALAKLRRRKTLKVKIVITIKRGKLIRTKTITVTLRRPK